MVKQMKIIKYLVVLIMFVQQVQAQEYFGLFYIIDEPKVFFLNQDSTSLSISCEYYDINNLAVEHFELNNNNLYISSISDTFDVELTMTYQKPRYYGNGIINGYGTNFILYPIEDKININKHLYIGKFVCRKLQDTLFIIQDSTTMDLVYISNSNSTPLYLINNKLAFTGTGIRIKSKYRLKKPWQLIIIENQKRNYYYRK